MHLRWPEVELAWDLERSGWRFRVGLGVEGGMGTRTGKEMGSVAKKHSSGRGKLLSILPKILPEAVLMASAK